MALRSMTGFARADGALLDTRWYWEARSVNGRGLDVRTRLPQGLEHLEPHVRERAQRHVTRGSVTLNLNVQRDTPAVSVRLNELALAEVVKAAEAVRAMSGASAPSADGLLAVRGVIDVVEAVPDKAAQAALNAAIMESLDRVLGDLVTARCEEGGRLAGAIGAQLAEIERLVAHAENAPGRTAAAIRARLEEQVRRLLETGAALDPARLHQEAVLIATRADVEEEIRRLEAHVRSARSMLEEGEPVGRKLDFLAQEFNREANTLTSKAIDVATAETGLALKAVIDQLREQVQNIE